MKNILIPTDFSGCANNALRFAASIAKKSGATINLIHVLDVPNVSYIGGLEGTVDDVPYMMGLLKATRTRMKKTLSQPFMKDVKAVDNIEVGKITESILKALEAHNADLVVMGTNGNDGIDDILGGGITEKVVRQSSVPVITIRNEVAESEIKKIVFATDFSDESEKVFPEVEKLAKLLDAEIEIVKVVTRSKFETTRESEESISNFRQKFPDSKFNTTIYYDFNKQNGIRRFADTKMAGVIALGTGGREGISGFFRSNITKDLVNHSSMPVLTIKPCKDSFNKPQEVSSEATLIAELAGAGQPFSLAEAMKKQQIPWI
ncbi:MAG: universal stress protein UspA [Bacteroidetes bacterium]|jgi:nucleotide-binding universal stress UspA family protein|nr:universal stress protein UspA [Bacteroidota bacterium]